MSFARALEHVLEEEGGWTNHPSDPGGETFMGITAGTLAAARKSDSDLPARVGDLTRSQVVRIYRARYWDAVDGDSLPAGIGLALFDAAVNHGPVGAIKLLQRALGVEPDGAIGPKTRSALDEAFPDALLSEFCAQRMSAYGRMPHFSTFGLGWSRRLFRTYRQALRQAVHA
jgi:lysozyme family protein